MGKLLLVDGHALLYRMFFGMPNKIYGNNNNMIQGTIGFVGGLLRTINDVHPDYILVVFDNEAGSFRDQVDDKYKGNRVRDFSEVADEMNPFTQLPDIKKVLEYLQIKYCEIEGFEADDVISAYSKNTGQHVVIMSNDTDLLQLVSDTTVVYDYRGKNSRIIYDITEVKNRYGVSPRLIPDFKAIVGDSSDNIKGIHGIGKKTAAKLLNDFEGIKELYSNINKVTPQRIQLLLSQNEQVVKKNLALIYLNNPIEFPFDLNELTIDPNIGKVKTMEALRNVDIIS